MHRRRRARFGLHFYNIGDSSPDVLMTLGGKLIREFPHGAGRGNRINRDYFAQGVGNVRRRRISVNHNHLFFGHNTSFLYMVG